MSEPEQNTADAPEAGTAPTAADPTKTHVAADWEHNSPLISCRFDPTGTYVFAGAQDATIQRWHCETGERAALAGHESWVRGMAFSPDGQTLYAGDFADRLLWWPVNSAGPEPIRSIEAHKGWVRTVAVSPDGAIVATGGNDNMVRLWSAADGAAIRELSGHESHVYNVLFHPAGEFLVSADLKGIVRQWNVETGEMVRQLDASKLYKYDGGFRADIGGVRGMAFNAEGTRLACAGITNVSNAFAGVGNPAVVLLDWNSGEEVQFHRGKEDVRSTNWGVAFHPDGYLIGVGGGGSGGFLYFWRPDEATEFFRLKLPDTGRDLALHPDGLRLAVAHFDGHLRLYSMTEKPPESDKEAAG